MASVTDWVSQKMLTVSGDWLKRMNEWNIKYIAKEIQNNNFAHLYYSILVLFDSDLKDVCFLSVVVKGSPSSLNGPLYLLYNNALLRGSSEESSNKSIIWVGYADDVLWMASGTTGETAHQTIENRLHEASQWSTTHSTPLDIEKTQYVLFTRNNNKVDNTELKCGDKHIKCLPSMKYLGVMLDKRLSFHEQTTMMTRRGYAAAAAIGRLANTSRGVSTKQFLMLYKIYTCAATDYASHVWLNPYKQSGKAIRTLTAELLEGLSRATRCLAV